MASHHHERTSSSSEYEAVRQCTGILVTTVQHCIPTFASECLSRGLISEDEEALTHTNNSNAEKAGYLVACVRDSIRNESANFDEFVEVLKSIKYLEGALNKLLERHRSLGGSMSPGNHNAAGQSSVASSSSSQSESTLERDSVVAAAATLQHSDPVPSSPHFISTSLEMTDSVFRSDSESTAMDTTEAPSTKSEIIYRLRNVKCRRSLGLLLEIESGKLDLFEGDQANFITQVVDEWFKMTPDMSESHRWEELTRVLLEPAVDEPTLAQDFLLRWRRGSTLSTPRSSIASPTDVSLRSEMDYIESIALRRDECTVQKVLKYIARYSHEWYVIGEYLVGHDRRHILEEIKNTFHSDHKAYVVELWYRVDPGRFSWAKLSQALKLVQARRPSATSMGESLTPSLPDELMNIDESLDLTPEQEEAEREINVLQEQFEEIQQQLIDTLREKGMEVKKFVDSVKTYLTSSHVQRRSFRELQKEADEYSISDIFGYWNEHLVWSFLDFALLEHIVKRMGSNTLKGLMKNYSNKMKEFRKRTKAHTLIKVWPNPVSDMCNYKQCKEILVKLKVNPEKCTLQSLENIRIRVCKLLKGVSLAEAALVVYMMLKGSLKLTWIVPLCLVEDFKNAFRECVGEGAFFRENKIARLELDGEVFIPKEEVLLNASKEGDVKDVVQALKGWDKDKFDINEPNEEGKPALILAAERNYGVMVVALLESEVGINNDYQTEDKKWSALFFAYNQGHDGIVKLLCEYGADTKLKDVEGRSPEEVGGHKVVKSPGRIQKIVQAGITLMGKVLPIKKNIIALCKDGKVDQVKVLLESGKSIDLNKPDTSSRAKKWTSLIWACENGHFEIVKLLVQHGADVDWKNQKGWTALHFACSNNFVRIANFLLKAGADPNSRFGVDGFTALLYISDMEDMEPLAWSLLEHGADPDMYETKQRHTSLIRASHFGKKELVQQYLDHGANPNFQADRGWTALMAAARKDRGDIAEILIEHGASTEIAMENTTKGAGEPALHVASYMGSANTVKVLLKKGADVNKINEVGLSALMIAVNREKTAVVDALLESDQIDVNLPQRDTGLTALFLAAKKGYIDIFEKLLQRGACDEIDSQSVLDVPSSKQKAIAACLQKHKARESELREVIRPEVKSEPARPQVIPESPQEMITEGSSDTITTGLPGKEESPKEEQDLTVAPQDAAKAEVAPQSTEAATEGEAAPCSIDERIPHEVTPAPLEGEAAQEEDKGEDKLTTADDDDSLYDAADLTEGTEIARTVVGVPVKQELSQEDNRKKIMNEKLAFLVKLLNDYNINMEPFVGEKQKGVPSVIEPSFPSASMAAH